MIVIGLFLLGLFLFLLFAEGWQPALIFAGCVGGAAVITALIAMEMKWFWGG